MVEEETMISRSGNGPLSLGKFFSVNCFCFCLLICPVKFELLKS